MQTVRTRRLLREMVGPDTGSMSSKDRETVMALSLAIGVAVLVLIAGCQQFAGNANAVAASQPDVVVHGNPDTPHVTWISQAHAQAARAGSDGAVTDLGY